MKRIPLPLALAFAIEALLAITTPFGLHSRAFQTVDLAGGLLADALAVVGLIWLARRAGRGPIATGATIAGAAWCVRFMLGLVSLALRPSTQLAWVGAMVALLVAAGFATLAAQRSRPLAAAVVVTAAAASSLPWLVLGIDEPLWLTASRLAHIAVMAVIVAGAGVEPAPRTAGGPPGRPFALASAGLYLLSLCLPAFVAGPLLDGRGGRAETTYGVVCVLYGWILWPGWLANPLLAVAGIIYALRRPSAALVLTCLALASAMLAPFLLRSSDLEIRHMHVGYGVWLASILSLGIAALRARARRPL